MSALSPETAIIEITAAITEARNAIAAGDLVELTGLDRAVARVCAAAHSLPAAERLAVAAQLVALADNLDSLALDLANRNGAAQRRHAVDAYRSGEQRP